MITIARALRILFSHPWTMGLWLALSLATTALFYWVFSENSTFQGAWDNNAHWYNIAQLGLSIANAVLIALALTMFFYLFHQREKHNLTIMQVLGSLGLSTLTTGCYVCGSVVLPTIGLAASLTALPFGGLEVKVVTLLLTGYAIYEYSEKVTGICHIRPRRPVQVHDKKIRFSKAWYDWQTFTVMASLVIALAILPFFPSQIGEVFGMSVRAHTPANTYSCGQVTLERK